MNTPTTPPVTPEELRELAKGYRQRSGVHSRPDFIRKYDVTAWACEQMAAQLEGPAPSRDAAVENVVREWRLILNSEGTNRIYQTTPLLRAFLTHLCRLHQPPSPSRAETK